VLGCGAAFTGKRDRGIQLLHACACLHPLVCKSVSPPSLALSSPQYTLLLLHQPVLLLSAMAAEPLECVDFDNATLQPWDGAAAYARDKRRQVALAAHLAEMWAPRGGCEGVGGRDGE
jgi:hypothetical protein